MVVVKIATVTKAINAIFRENGREVGHCNVTMATVTSLYSIKHLESGTVVRIYLEVIKQLFSTSLAIAMMPS